MHDSGRVRDFGRMRDSGSGIDSSCVAGTMSFSGAATRDEGSPEAAWRRRAPSAARQAAPSFALPQRDVLDLVPEA